MNYEEKCLAVCEIAKKAGEFIRTEREKFSADKIEYKGKQDMVSYVDKGAEIIVVKALSELIPEAAFITEEKTVENTGKTDGYFWIIDPLDGTTNFIHGAAPYCVSIALSKGTEIVIGVIYEVCADECFYAWKDSAAYLNGKQISVSKVPVIEESLIISGFSHASADRVGEFLFFMDYLTSASHGVRRLGSAAADLAFIAAGRYDGFLQFNLSEWDVAAGTLIVERAGGKVTDYKGGDNFIYGREIVATNGLIHNSIRELALLSTTKNI